MGNTPQVNKSLHTKSSQSKSDSNQKPVEEPTIVPKKDFPAVYSIITAPRKCPDGQKLDGQGRCREIV